MPWRLGRHCALGGLYAGLLLAENDSLLSEDRESAGQKAAAGRKVCRTAIRLQVTGGLGFLARCAGLMCISVAGLRDFRRERRQGRPLAWIDGWDSLEFVSVTWERTSRKTRDGTNGRNVF